MTSATFGSTRKGMRMRFRKNFAICSYGGEETESPGKSYAGKKRPKKKIGSKNDKWKGYL